MGRNTGSLEASKRWTRHVPLVLVISLYFGLLAYFAPPRVVFSTKPVLTIDYALHVYQVERARVAFRGWGKLWGYDPQVLAGQPAGLVEDLTSKGTELFVIALSTLGVHPGLAFNLFIVLVHLGMPLTCLAAARLFGLSRAESTVALLLWVLLWFFDSFLHWCWWIGMISWSAGCYLSVLYVALFHRALESRRVLWFGLLLLLGAALTLIHPFGAFAVAMPCLLMYARAFPTLRVHEHVLVGVAVLAAASTVLIWIGPLLRYRHYFGDADTFFRPTAEYLLYDSLDLVKDWTNTGGPVRTLIRTLGFAAGGICLFRWYRTRDRRVLPLLALITSGLLMAYLSGYSWYARQTQPYRQIGPAILAAALPAAGLLRELLAPRALKELTRPARLLLALAVILILPRFARDVVYYFPELLPDRVTRSKLDFVSSALVELPGEAKPFSTRHRGPLPAYESVRGWLERNHAGRGRVLVGEWVLAEYLATATTIPILGGLLERNVPHVDAHLFRLTPDKYLLGPGLKGYLERYAVGLVILEGALGPLDFRRDVLEPLQVVDDFRIYRTRIQPSYFLRGTGVVSSQTLNSIVVDRAAGEEVVLRFHWMEILRCRPGCVVERESVPDDRVGFIRVVKPPPHFEIYAEY